MNNKINKNTEESWISIEELQATIKMMLKFAVKNNIYEKKLSKLSPGKLYELLENNILISTLIVRILTRNIDSPSKWKVDHFYEKMQFIFHELIEQLTRGAYSDEKLFLICYEMANYATKVLMRHAYKSPTRELCKRLNTELEMPFLVSSWDSAKEMKDKFDEISKRMGLAKAFEIKTKSRFSAVPTRVIFEDYKFYFILSSVRPIPLLNLPPLSQATFMTWWEGMKKGLILYFNNILPNVEPEYYRSLRDDRGDKTPIGYKRKLWLQACKQALKGIAQENTSDASPDSGA